MTVVLTPEAQAILDEVRAKKAKKEPTSKAATKKTKAEVEASLKTAPRKQGESMYHGHGEQFSNEAFFGELGDTLAVMGSGATAGAGPWAIEKLSGYPARQKVLKAKERLGSTDAAASEIFGAVAPAVVGPGLATVAAKTPGLLGGAARAGLSGVEGAGYGATSAATDLDETTSPLMGGAVGGAFGVGGQLLGEGAGAAWNWLKGIPADQEVARIAATQPQAAQNLAGLGREGMVADVLDEEGRALVRKISDASPEARQILLGATEPRRAAQHENIIGAVEEAANIAPQHRLTPDELVEQLREARRPAIDEAYREAQEAGFHLPRETRSRTIQEPVPPGTAVLEEGATNVTPQQIRSRVVTEETEIPSFFADLINTPSGGREWRRAGRTRQDWEATHGPIVNSDLWRLDETMKNLRGQAQAARQRGDRPTATRLGNLATAFRNRMDGLLDLPEYAAARGEHQNMAQEISAIERGAELATGRYPPTLTREAIAAREGPRGALLGAAQAQGYGHAKAAQLLGDRSLAQSTAPFRSTLGQEGAQAALGDRAAIVEEAVRRADIFRDTAKVPSGGSQTSRNSIPIIASELAKQLSAPALVGGLTLAHGLATGDASAYKTASAVVLTMAAKYGLNKLQARQLSTHLPEIARILVGQEIPIAAPFRSGPASQIGSAVAKGGGLLGAQ